MEASRSERDEGKESENKGKRILEEEEEKEKSENERKRIRILSEQEESEKRVLEIMKMCESEFRQILGEIYDKEILMAIVTYVIGRKKRGNPPLLPLATQLQLDQILHEIEQQQQEQEQEQRAQTGLDLNASPPQD